MAFREAYAAACVAARKRMPECLWSAYDAEDIVGDAIVNILKSKQPEMIEIPAALVNATKWRLHDLKISPRSRYRRLDFDLARSSSIGIALEEEDEVAKVASLADTPLLERMIRLKAQGYDVPEIAQICAISARKAQRLFKRFRENVSSNR